LQDNAKVYGWIFVKFGESVDNGYGPERSWLNFESVTYHIDLKV